MAEWRRVPRRHRQVHVHRHRHGYRYRALGPANPFQLAAALAEKVTPALHSAHQARVADLASRFIDGTAPVPAGRRSTTSHLAAAFAISEGTSKVRAIGHRDPFVDFGCEVNILADPAHPRTCTCSCTARSTSRDRSVP